MNYTLTACVLAALVGGASTATAQTAPSLGAARTFAVLGASTVTNTGATTVSGDIGVSPGTAITGFPPGVVVNGTINAGNTAALAAQQSVATAYNELTDLPCGTNLTGQNLGGMTLSPGVYCFNTSAQLTGTLTLDAGGDPDAVFVFQIGSTLTTASNASVVVSGGSACNIFWQVGSSATLGTNTAFAGNVLAVASITVTTGASVNGRALAQNGAVTLDTNSVVAPCTADPPVCPIVSLLPVVLPDGQVAVPYSQTMTASGGASPYTYSVTTGTLPTGLTLTPEGVLAGTPSVAVAAPVTIRATDADGCFVDVDYTITIAPAVCPTLALLPATMPAGTVGLAYSQTMTASGGASPYTFTVTTGTLPTGLTLTPGGVLAGTPSVAVAAPVTIRATDANGCFIDVAYTVTIVPAVCPTLALLPATMPAGTVSLAYSQTMTASGGASPYAYTVTTGTLPTGLTLTPEGVLAGTPSVAVAAPVTIRATDANGCFVDVAYTIAIAPAVCPTLALLPATMPAGTVGLAYSQTMTASGGASPYTFSVTTGTLPAGLSLTSQGILAGMPTVDGIATMTIRVTDANGCFADRSFTITIPLSVPAVPFVSAVALAGALLATGFFRLRRRARR